MNRHKTYWSVMGIEPSEKENGLTKLREKHKEDILKMIDEYAPYNNNFLGINGFDEVVRILREIKEGEE